MRQTSPSDCDRNPMTDSNLSSVRRYPNGPTSRRSRTRVLLILFGLAWILVLCSPPVASAALEPFASSAVQCSPSDPSFPGDEPFVTSASPGRHKNVNIRITTSGAAGGIDLTDGSAANFGASDSAWLAYGYQVTPSYPPEGDVTCPAGPVAATIDYFDVPDLPTTFTGLSTGPCSLGDFNTSFKRVDACSDVTFQVTNQTYYAVTLSLSSGTVTLTLPYTGGSTRRTFSRSGTWALGYLNPVAWDLLISSAPGPQAAWSVTISATTRSCGSAPQMISNAVWATPNVRCTRARTLMHDLLGSSEACYPRGYTASPTCTLEGFRCSAFSQANTGLTSGRCIDGTKKITDTAGSVNLTHCGDISYNDGAFTVGITARGLSCSEAKHLLDVFETTNPRPHVVDGFRCGPIGGGEDREIDRCARGTRWTKWTEEA